MRVTPVPETFIDKIKYIIWNFCGKIKKSFRDKMQVCYYT